MAKLGRLNEEKDHLRQEATQRPKKEDLPWCETQILDLLQVWDQADAYQRRPVRFSYRLVDVVKVPAKLSAKLSGLSCAWLRGNELASSMKWRASDEDVPPWPQDDAAVDPFSPSGC
jgi:hypothetical protein